MPIDKLLHLLLVVVWYVHYSDLATAVFILLHRVKPLWDGLLLRPTSCQPGHDCEDNNTHCFHTRLVLFLNQGVTTTNTSPLIVPPGAKKVDW